MQIYLLGVPLLPSAPPPLSADIKATEVMSAPAVVFPSKVRVGRLIDVLENVPHNGFPIVDSSHTTNQVTFLFKIAVEKLFLLNFITKTQF